MPINSKPRFRGFAVPSGFWKEWSRNWNRRRAQRVQLRLSTAFAGPCFPGLVGGRRRHHIEISDNRVTKHYISRMSGNLSMSCDSCPVQGTLRRRGNGEMLACLMCMFMQNETQCSALLECSPRRLLNEWCQ